MLPLALTRDVPILYLTGTSSEYEDDTFYLELKFRPVIGSHHETELGFCGWPLAHPNQRGHPGEKIERDPGYMATVATTGAWVDGGLIFCGLSSRELQLEWRREAAEKLHVPQLTVVELRINNGNTTSELRAALRLLFERDMPERPQVELIAPFDQAEQLELPLP